MTLWLELGCASQNGIHPLFRKFGEKLPITVEVISSRMECVILLILHDIKLSSVSVCSHRQSRFREEVLGPYTFPVNPWKLMNAGEGRVIASSCLPIGETSCFQWVVRHPRSCRWPWLNSGGHNTKQKDMDVRNGVVRRRGFMGRGGRQRGCGQE